MGNKQSSSYSSYGGRPQDQQNQPYAGTMRPPMPQYVPPQYTMQPQYPMNNGQFYGQQLYGSHFTPQYPVAPNHYGQLTQPPAASEAAVTTTKQIRNLVNLKKKSLKVLPRSDNPDILQIEFAFDASAPCSATTFVCATEELNAACQLTPAVQAAAPRMLFEKGLGQMFPATTEDGPSQHIVDVSKHIMAQLLESHKHTFPLVVRLETITEAGQKEGRTFAELEPGCSLPSWVQAQTTFAVLTRQQGAWGVQVMKQNIWVDEHSYELQEIYGIDESLRKAEDGGRECIICMTADRDTTLMPCRHLCMCRDCASELFKQSRKCPICRQPIQNLLKIDLTAKSAEASAHAPPNAAAVAQ